MSTTQYEECGLSSPELEAKTLARGREFRSVLIPENVDEFQAKSAHLAEVLQHLSDVPGCFVVWIKPAPENQE